MALGVHWPLDVCAGALVGLAAAGFGVPLGGTPYPRVGTQYLLTLVLIAASFPLRLALGSETGLSSAVPALPWIGSALWSSWPGNPAPEQGLASRKKYSQGRESPYCQAWPGLKN